MDTSTRSTAAAIRIEWIGAVLVTLGTGALIVSGFMNPRSPLFWTGLVLSASTATNLIANRMRRRRNPAVKPLERAGLGLSLLGFLSIAAILWFQFRAH